MTENGTKKKIYIIIAIFIVLLCAVAMLLIYARNKNSRVFTGYGVEAKLVTDYNNETKFIPYQDGYIHYNRDGAEAVGDRGELLWNVGYDFKNPIIAVCGEYTVVADCGSLEAYIFDGTGKQKKVEAINPIQEVEISKEGIAAIRMKEGTKDKISLVGMDDTKYVDITTNEQTDGFPVDITLSKDGTRLVTTYIIIEEGELRSRVSFYNFSQVGQNYVDRLVGIYKYDSLVLAASFLSQNDVSVFFEDKILTYQFKETPTDPVSIEELGIRDVFFDKDYIGTVTNGKEKRYSVRIYTKEGKNIFDVETELEYTSVVMSDEIVTLYNNCMMQVWDISGALRFEGTLGEDVKLIVPADDYKYIVLHADRMETIRLIKTDE